MTIYDTSIRDFIDTFFVLIVNFSRSYHKGTKPKRIHERLLQICITTEK